MQKQVDLLNIIKNKYSSFSRSHKIIADGILQNWETLAFVSPQELGNKLGVSETTVIRFAKELGFNNYSQLRSHVQDLIKIQLSPAQKMIKSVGRVKNNENPLIRLLETEVATLQKSINMISEEDFIKSVDLICNARRVFIMGFGVSVSLCHFLDFRFRRMQIDTSIITQGSKHCFEQLMLAGEKDVLIGIGFFRCAEEILKAFKYAKNQGIATIAVTNSPLSELANLSSLTLVSYRGPLEEIKSLVVPMAVLNSLVIAVARKDEEKSMLALRKLEQIHGYYRDDLP